jgi:hypothetical protein
MEYAYGREENVFVKKEVAMGTYVHPAGTDAIAVLSCDMQFKQDRKKASVKTSLRSQLTKVTGRKSASWSIEKYLLPSGVAGTAPDDADLWEALFGKATTGAGSVAYSLTKEPSIALSILRQYGPHQEAVCGAVPGKASIKFGGGDEPKVTFSGDAVDHLFSGSDVLTAEVTADDAIVVTDARQFSLGMKVKVGTEDNTTGFIISAIDYDTNTLTLSTAVEHQLTGAAVVPFGITPVTAGEILAVTAGTVTLGGETIYLTGCTVDIDQAPKLRNDEYGQAAPRGLRYPDPRVVKCSMDLYFERGAAKWLNNAKRFGALDASIVMGSVAGKQVQIDLKAIEFDIPSVKIPEKEECTITLAGQADGTAAGDDEIVVTFK